MLVALFATSLAWWIDRSNLRDQLDRRDSSVLLDALTMAGANKHNQWSPSVYFNTDSDAIETILAEHLASPDGDLVESRQGWSSAQLRRPGIETTNAVVGLLENDDAGIRKSALRLIALYSEAYISLAAYGDTQTARTHFRKSCTPHLFALLRDADPEIRGLAALAIGYTCPWRSSIENLTLAYKRETNADAKVYIAWAIDKQY